jgi:hypothetical protein
MFNLIVGYTDGAIEASRMLEYTSDQVKAYLQPAGVLDPLRLVGLPTLVMPETGGDPTTEFARIGHIESINLVGKQYRYRLAPRSGVLPIPSQQVVAVAGDLGIADWEFTRSHWAVKERDLYGALYPQLVPPVSPKVFALPKVPREPDLVAVMMPFDAGFAPVYAALGEAVVAAGMRCQRADDIWVHDHLMDEIISLIWRARVVISDLSGKNANVFYETGIAHTLGRDVIQIARSETDVPFDLRHLRYIDYLPNAEGLGKLKERVTERLKSLSI